MKPNRKLILTGIACATAVTLFVLVSSAYAAETPKGSYFSLHDWPQYNETATAYRQLGNGSIHDVMHLDPVTTIGNIHLYHYPVPPTAEGSHTVNVTTWDYDSEVPWNRISQVWYPREPWVPVALGLHSDILALEKSGKLGQKIDSDQSDRIKDLERKLGEQGKRILELERQIALLQQQPANQPNNPN